LSAVLNIKSSVHTRRCSLDRNNCTSRNGGKEGIGKWGDEQKEMDTEGIIYDSALLALRTTTSSPSSPFSPSFIVPYTQYVPFLGLLFLMADPILGPIFLVALLK
jgi:hypothetical protein